MSDGDEQSRGDWVYEEEGQDMNKGVSTFQHGLGLQPTCWLKLGKWLLKGWML